MTCSKAALNILNRCGHVINYHEVKQYDTEIAYSVADSGNECPDGIIHGVEDFENAATQIQNHRVEKDNKQVKMLSEKIDAYCNPFLDDPLLQENLINLATGKAARKETEEFLLNTLMRGDNERKRFLEEWIDLPSRFMQTVKRIKVSNFASENLSQKNIFPTDNKINKAESARDVFIRIALLASSNSNFDLKRVMSFPIT